jgi:hypothetical protein
MAVEHELVLTDFQINSCAYETEHASKKFNNWGETAVSRERVQAIVILHPIAGHVGVSQERR